MAISYFPLEPDFQPPPPSPVPILQEPSSQPVTNSISNFLKGETTECNYLVFAFVAGVLMLALTDSMRR
jgi:hypothetical protein